MIQHLAVLAAACFLVSCGTGKDQTDIGAEEALQATDRIAEQANIRAVKLDFMRDCGGGINLSERTSLQAKVNKATKSGSLSISDETSLRAAFLDAYEGSNKSVSEMFDRYIDCILGEESLNREIDLIEARAANVESTLRAIDVPDDVIQNIAVLREQEIESLRRKRYDEARDINQEIGRTIVDALFTFAGNADAMRTLLFSDTNIINRDGLKTEGSRQAYEQQIRDEQNLCVLFFDRKSCSRKVENDLVYDAAGSLIMSTSDQNALLDLLSGG